VQENWKRTSTGAAKNEKMESTRTHNDDSIAKHRKDIKEDDDPGTLEKRDVEKEMQTVGFRYSWRQCLKTELDGVEWFVGYAPWGVTRHKSSQVVQEENTANLLVSLVYLKQAA